MVGALLGAQAGVTDANAGWSLVISLLALAIAVSSFIYTVFVKPKLDLRQGSLVRRLERHEDAVSRLRRLAGVDAAKLRWALHHLVLLHVADPEGRPLAERAEEAQRLSKELEALGFDLMNRELADAVRELRQHPRPPRRPPAGARERPSAGAVPTRSPLHGHQPGPTGGGLRPRTAARGPAARQEGPAGSRPAGDPRAYRAHQARARRTRLLRRRRRLGRVRPRSFCGSSTPKPAGARRREGGSKKHILPRKKRFPTGCRSGGRREAAPAQGRRAPWRGSRPRLLRRTNLPGSRDPSGSVRNRL